MAVCRILPAEGTRPFCWWPVLPIFGWRFQLAAPEVTQPSAFMLLRSVWRHAARSSSGARQALGEVSLARGLISTTSHRWCADAAADRAGMGCSKAIEGVSRTHLIKAMMHAIDSPAKFLPVSNVVVQPAMGDAGEDGALWRSMKWKGGGPHDGAIIHHCYANPSSGEVRFVELMADGATESEFEVVHALVKTADDAYALHHFRRQKDTLERTRWDLPRALVEAAIETTVGLARAAASQAADGGAFAAKA